jgi:uncharacterized protein
MVSAVRSRRAPVVASLLLAATSPATAGSYPPAPHDWVTDEAGLLPQQARQGLDARLAAFERATGYQVVVWIGQSTGGASLEEWAARTFEAWGIGRRGKDDGVAFFVLARDRRARIEVGYGLEGVLTDATSSRILHQVLEPGMRAGQPECAVAASADALMRALAPGQVPPGATQPTKGPAQRRIPLPGLILVGIAVLAFLVLLVANPSLALFILYAIFTGGRGGGGGGGGGGFSGGGRSGGGGPSGGW